MADGSSPGLGLSSGPSTPCHRGLFRRYIYCSASAGKTGGFELNKLHSMTLVTRCGILTELQSPVRFFSSTCSTTQPSDMTLNHSVGGSSPRASPHHYVELSSKNAPSAPAGALKPSETAWNRAGADHGHGAQALVRRHCASSSTQGREIMKNVVAAAANADTPTRMNTRSMPSVFDLSTPIRPARIAEPTIDPKYLLVE
jgi:hypothetical protein